MIALYRFRPEAREAVRAAVASAPPDDGARGTPLAEVALTLGAYDLAARMETVGGAGADASRALAVADAVIAGRLWRARDGWSAALAPPPVAATPPAIDAFAGLAAETPLSLLRAKGGWNLVAAPDRETWRTLSMTFLTRRAWERFAPETAWRSPDVNELATLVMGTHHTRDVEGTCLTYGIPGLSLADWEDEAQAAALGGGPEAAPAALLAESLHYAALLRGPDAPLRRALAPLGADLFIEARGAFTPTEGDEEP